MAVFSRNFGCWCDIMCYIIGLIQLKCYRQTVKKNYFTQDSIVNEPLSPERIFVSSKSFLFKFVISRFFYNKKFDCDEEKNVSVCDRRKPNSSNPKNDFDRDFLARALCTMVILKLHTLFICIHVYVYVCSKTIFFPVDFNWCVQLSRWSKCNASDLELRERSRVQFSALTRIFMIAFCFHVLCFYFYCSKALFVLKFCKCFCNINSGSSPSQMCATTKGALCSFRVPRSTEI